MERLFGTLQSRLPPLMRQEGINFVFVSELVR